MSVLPIVAGATVLLYAADRLDHMMFMGDMRSQHNLKKVVSTVDQKPYFVAHGVDAANCLARVRQMAWAVMQELHKRKAEGKVPKEFLDGVARIRGKLKCVDDIEVAELNDYKANLIAFNRNKGDMIMLCLTDNQQLVGDDVVLFILLHEIVHSMTSGYDPLVEGRTQHGPEFLAYENYVYSVATDMGMVKPRAVQGHGVCGTRISHPNPASLPN
jgi:hypothetical protein